MKNDKSNSDVSRGYIAWAVILILLFVLIWTFSGIGRLSRSINPASGNAPSTSMEPVTVSFKYGLERGENFEELAPNKRPYEWLVKIPRRFIWSLHGSNGSVLRKQKDGNELFVNIEGVVDILKDEILPVDLAKPISDHSIVFYLSNHRGIPQIMKSSSCVRQEDFKKFLNEKEDTLYKCTTPRCDIYTELDGWDITLTVSPALYKNPDKTCLLAKSFLNMMTVRRDSIR
jgi:hypothetical protein